MPAPCEECQKRPSGLEGHEGIFLSADARTSTGRHLFRCARCQSLWLRDYQGDGVFTWIFVPPEQAIEGDG